MPCGVSSPLARAAPAVCLLRHAADAVLRSRLLGAAAPASSSCPCLERAALSPVLRPQMGLLNSGAVAAAVVGWPRLRRLRLTACVNLGDATMEAVAAHAPGLTFLDVSRCHNGMNSE